jgi:hypothetical protein
VVPTCRWSLRIYDRLSWVLATMPVSGTWIISIPVAYPLPNVSQYIVERIPVWLFLTDWMSSTAAVAPIPSDIVNVTVAFSR